MVSLPGGQAANIHLNTVHILQKCALRLMHFVDNKAHSTHCLLTLFNSSEQVHHHLTRFSAVSNLHDKTSRTNQQLLFSLARIGAKLLWNLAFQKNFV